jgi:hypothetical protein
MTTSIIAITVAPETRNPGNPPQRVRFIASLATSGRVLGAFSAPLLGAARVLLAEVVPPETAIQMRHSGSGTVALRSTVGGAAGLTVSEEGSTGAPQFTKWKPFDRTRQEAAA